MPKIFRIMKGDADGPIAGVGRELLGVRLPGGVGHADVVPNEEGVIAPATGGMSVCSGALALLGRAAPMMPKRFRALAHDPSTPVALRELFIQASGSNSAAIWQMGDGEFEAGPLTQKLSLRPDSADHGLVEPFVAMSVAEYLTALEQTRSEWMRDESFEGGLSGDSYVQ